MIKIKLMPDYQCYPLWGMSENNLGNIDPRSLPISEKLISNLMDWAKKYDATLNLEEPINSGFATKEFELAFKKEGEYLLNRLRIELGNSYHLILKI